MRIGFFGAGNMVEALALGIFSKGGDHQLYFYTPSKSKAKALSDKTNGEYVENLENMPEDLDWYVLGFKPINLNDFHFIFRKDAKVISLLASVPLANIKNKLNVNKMLRVMPNTPSKVFAGMNLLYFSNEIDEVEQQKICTIFQSVGEILVVPNEEDIDFLTPYTGSGPGILFELLSYFEKSVPNFLSQKYDVKKLLAQTMFGSAKLILESNESIETLRDQVTSKKGVTIEAINGLREGKVEMIINDSMKRALIRLNEMKEEVK
jgi:pyrroline-5-carboxylate reductase